MEKKMSRPNSEYIQSIIEKEGFDYAFEGYSDFPEVEDPIFHEYRLAYLKARQNLLEYMNIE